jgi:NAD+ synthase
MGTLERLRINTDLTRRLISRFIYNEVTKAGFSRVVVGLSGGVDSSLVAFLTVDALGKDNVLGVLMPYRTSAPSSLADAQMVVDQLGIPSIVIDITPMVDPLIALNPHMDARRRGNIMARMRMIVLYDQSEEFRGLVAGTSNKTETLLGYTTIYGDNAAAIQPIADLYKCQVRQLAAALGVPERIIGKAPTADLWQGQTDEGELGFTYDTADQILYLLVDMRYTPDEVVAAGFERPVVQHILRLVQQNQFKRTPAPIAKVSNRTVNIDFLYARDWGT